MLNNDTQSQALGTIAVEAIFFYAEGDRKLMRQVVQVTSSCSALQQAQEAANLLKLNTHGMLVTRFGKKLKAGDTLVQHDQIAWVHSVATDVNMARQARVANQRKDARARRQGRTSGAMNQDSA